MTIREALNQRILILDGAMGTCIQKFEVFLHIQFIVDRTVEYFAFGAYDEVAGL